MCVCVCACVCVSVGRDGGRGSDRGRGKDREREEVRRMKGGRERGVWREGEGRREGEGEVKRRGDERWMKGVQIKYMKNRGREKKEEGEWYGGGGTRMSARKQRNRWLYRFSLGHFFMANSITSVEQKLVFLRTAVYSLFLSPLLFPPSLPLSPLSFLLLFLCREPV